MTVKTQNGECIFQVVLGLWILQGETPCRVGSSNGFESLFDN